MTFEEILPCLKRGDVVTRDAFYDGLVVFMQVPATISPDMVPKMTSLPEAMKQLLQESESGISYHDQFIMFDLGDCTCTYYPFDGEDFTATDWTVVRSIYG